MQAISRDRAEKTNSSDFAQKRRSTYAIEKPRKFEKHSQQLARRLVFLGRLLKSTLVSGVLIMVALILDVSS
jgi:hypothetical protein